MPRSTTYMVECFWPDVHEQQVELFAERLKRSTEVMVAEGRQVAYTGSILVPGDEIVFFLFEGASGDVVGKACERAGLAYERIVESVPRAAVAKERT